MKIKVLIDTLNHNGRKRVPGELIDIEDAGAAHLIKVGAAEVAKEEPVPTNPDKNQDPVSDSAEVSETGVTEKPDDVDKPADDASDKTSEKGKKDTKSKDK